MKYLIPILLIFSLGMISASYSSCTYAGCLNDTNWHDNNFETYTQLPPASTTIVNLTIPKNTINATLRIKLTSIGGQGSLTCLTEGQYTSRNLYFLQGDNQFNIPSECLDKNLIIKLFSLAPTKLYDIQVKFTVIKKICMKVKHHKICKVVFKEIIT
jgi:hypothetical protein